MLLLSPEHDGPALFAAPEGHIATTSGVKAHICTATGAGLLKWVG